MTRRSNGSSDDSPGFSPDSRALEESDRAEGSITLGVFARYPEPGSVKTRLAASLGDVTAARLYDAFLRDVLSSVGGGEWRSVVAYTPETPLARDWFERVSPAGTLLWPQPDGHLGARLAAFFGETLSAPGSMAMAIGSDSPSCPVEMIRSAVDLLAARDVVIGPAMDGGYFLIGLRRPSIGTRDPASCRRLLQSVFDGIDWGGPAVLRETVERVQAAGLSLGLLPPWCDVDTIEDLRYLRDHLGALEAAGLSSPCPLTAALLADLEL